jgi:hypothetical protein
MVQLHDHILYQLTKNLVLYNEIPFIQFEDERQSGNHMIKNVGRLTTSSSTTFMSTSAADNAVLPPPPPPPAAAAAANTKDTSKVPISYHPKTSAGATGNETSSVHRKRSNSEFEFDESDDPNRKVIMTDLRRKKPKLIDKQIISTELRMNSEPVNVQFDNIYSQQLNYDL